MLPSKSAVSAALHLTPRAHGGPQLQTAAPKTPPVRRGSSAWPVLITEQEVMLATAAASLTPARPNLLTRWITALRTVTAVRPAAERPSRPRYEPRRYSYLEYATIAREMERL